jgi:hypothetical protein
LCAFGILVLAVGCTRYVPTTLDRVPPGGDVRIEVTPDAVPRVQEFTLSSAGPRVDAWVTSLSADSVVFEMWRTDPALIGSPAFRPGQVQVPLARTQVHQVWEKQLSRVRTGALVAAVVGGVYLLVDVAFGGTGGGVGGGGGGPAIDLIPGPGR